MRVNLNLAKSSFNNAQKRNANMNYSTTSIPNATLAIDRVSFGNNDMDSELKKLLSEAEQRQMETNKTISTLRQMLSPSNNTKGFSRIAGYEEQKKILINHIATPLELERVGKPADVPAGVLLFGPKGVGKTTFAKSLAEQFGCKIVTINNNLDDKNNFKALNEAAILAQQGFAKDGIRTLLLIDNFEDFAPKESRMTGVMKGFMDEVSSKYHCTVLALTDHPEKIDRILLNDYRFGIKVGLPPANQENTAAILKHYAEGFAKEGINYDELAEQMVKNQPKEAFSNARINRIIKGWLIDDNNFGRKMTQYDLLYSIKKIGPDLTQKTLEAFKNQLEYVKHL